jgi:hypothetical protein
MAPDTLACLHPGGIVGMCGEGTDVADKEASRARCTDSGGENHPGPCPKELVLASCTFKATKAASFLYSGAAKSGEEARGMIHGMKGSCEQSGGTFTLADTSVSTVSCTATPVCAESTLAPASETEAAQIIDKCKQADATGQASPCPRAGALAECSWEDSHGVLRRMFTYSVPGHDTPIEAQEAIGASKNRCASKYHGTFAAPPRD